VAICLVLKKFHAHVSSFLCYSKRPVEKIQSLHHSCTTDTLSLLFSVCLSHPHTWIACIPHIYILVSVFVPSLALVPFSLMTVTTARFYLGEEFSFQFNDNSVVNLLIRIIIGRRQIAVYGMFMLDLSLVSVLRFWGCYWSAHGVSWIFKPSFWCDGTICFTFRY